MSHLSAQFSTTLRVHLDDRPGSFAGSPRRSATRAGCSTRSTSSASSRARRSATSPCSRTRAPSTRAGDRRRRPRARRRRGRARLRPHVPAPPRRQDRGRLEDAAEDARRPLDGLHARASPASAPRSPTTRRRSGTSPIKQNTVAVVTDGTAVLGLGDIGPEAALPVMEGKAMLFKEFGGVDAWPICLATTDVDEIVAAVDRDRARLRRDQPRGHLRAALLRDRAAAAGARSTSPSSTTTSTARRSSCSPRS